MLLKKEETTVPALHVYMMNVGLVVMLAAMLAYFFAPADKAPAFGALMTTAMGFLVGKYSNNFKRNDNKPE